MKPLKKVLFPAIAFAFLFSIPVVSAHPWGGLVIDQQGNIYFTFICPMTDDDHYACVWQVDVARNIIPYHESEHSPSDIIVSRSPGRLIYGAERSGSSSRHTSRLWHYGRDKQLIIPPTTDETLFHIQAYTAADDGTIFFGRDDQLYKRTTDGKVSAVEMSGAVMRVDAMAWGPDETLYIIDRDALHILGTDGNLSTIATGLKEEDPEHLPFSGANILFDLAVDEAGNAYIAYYGNRRVLKVTPSGKVTTLVEAESPWSPHGVDVFDGEVYILESTVGGDDWWRPWGEPVIIPRIRKVARDGTVRVVFEYEAGD